MLSSVILLRTNAFPAHVGLPRGRFFIIQPPGPASVDGDVTLLNTAGQRVAFADF